MARFEDLLMEQVGIVHLPMFVFQLSRIVDDRGVALGYELVSSGVVPLLPEPCYLSNIGGDLNLGIRPHRAPIPQGVLVSINRITEYHLLYLTSVFC